MAAKLNKELYTQVSKLKNLTANTNPKFILEQSPFKDDEEEGGAAATSSSGDLVIIGRIFPDSVPYNIGAYKIEIKLTATYPFEPPEVRFLTKIYHPNVDKEGLFCHELLKQQAKWSKTTTVVDVVKAVTERIDDPDIEYSLSLVLGREYMEDRSEFNRKASEFAEKHALPRA